MKSALKTVIVDDEPLARMRLRSLLLAQDEFEISAECGDGVAALETIQRLRPDVVFLDVEMPEMKGMEVAYALQVAPAPALVFVTAFPEHAVEAFAISAVDYLLKPYDEERFLDSLARVRVFCDNRKLRESNSRLLAHLHRHPDALESWGETDVDPEIRLNDITIDVRKRTARRGEAELHLRPKEFDLAVALVGRAGTVVDRRQLLSEVWGYDSHVVSRTVDTHVGELRRKLGILEGEPGFIESVFGMGYRVRL